jgi:hypothetical protein
MFLSAVLFVLFLAGCWLYCLTDAALTPAAEFPGLRKPVWIAVIAVTFIPGAIAWFITRKLWRIRYWPTSPAGPANAGSDAAPARQYPDHPATASRGYRAAEALARHPASQSRNVPERTAPIGPDDDPEFLRMLDRLISGSSDPTELEVARIGLPGSDAASPRAAPGGVVVVANSSAIDSSSALPGIARTAAR